MLSDFFHPNFFQIIYCSSQANSSCDVWSARFKFPWKLVWLPRIFVDFLYHISAIEERTHLFKNFSFSNQSSNSSGTKHLVAGEAKKISVNFFKIDRHVRNRLCCINNEQAIIFTSHSSYFLNLIYSAKNIRDMNYGYYLCFFIYLLFIFLHL